MLTGRHLLLAIVLVVAAGAVAAIVLAWQPAIAAIAPPSRSAFPPATIARGAELAAIGDCAVCHTAAGGRPYAGGRALPTPFGLIYVTNITPDPDTGIGRWSEAAFRRAMRDGIGRTGWHLYPALPYPHFTRATDADIAALYAFLMTRAPVRASTPPNRLPFPLNLRATIAGWNLLFLRPGPWRPDPAKSPEWNRGAYLVEGVGHCGACHTPHNVLGAEQGAEALKGGVAEGWYAPSLSASSPARHPWTQDALAAYLGHGFTPQHGAAAGPMRAVTLELAVVPDQDVRAIAAYIAAQIPAASHEPDPVIPRALQPDPVFAGACSGCHEDDAPMQRAGAPSLALGTAVNAPTPRDAIQTILHGIPWREGAAQPYMPGFAPALSDAQVTGLVRYLRARYSDRPAWTGIAAWVRRLRRQGGA